MTGMTDKDGLFFIEEILLNSVKKLLTGRVNELLGEMEYPIPPVEFGTYRGGSTVVGACNLAITISTCERSEKEWIVRLDAYTRNMARYQRRRIGMIGNLRGSGKDGEHLESSMPENVRVLLEPYRWRTI
jgi:hypothetical protein